MNKLLKSKADQYTDLNIGKSLIKAIGNMYKYVMRYMIYLMKYKI